MLLQRVCSSSGIAWISSDKVAPWSGNVKLHFVVSLYPNDIWMRYYSFLSILVDDHI